MLFTIPFFGLEYIRLSQRIRILCYSTPFQQAYLFACHHPIIPWHLLPTHNNTLFVPLTCQENSIPCLCTRKRSCNSLGTIQNTAEISPLTFTYRFGSTRNV